MQDTKNTPQPGERTRLRCVTTICQPSSYKWGKCRLTLGDPGMDFSDALSIFHEIDVCKGDPPLRPKMSIGSGSSGDHGIFQCLITEIADAVDHLSGLVSKVG